MGRVKTLERSGKRSLMRALGGLLHARPISPQEFRSLQFDRILVIRQHNQMGDMMLAIPALRAIKETYPHARVGVVSSTLNAGVLANSPYVDRVFTYDKTRPLTGVRLIRHLRAERFDLAIVLHTVSFSFTSLILAVLSRANVRIGSTSRAIGDSLTGSYLSITLPLPDAAALERMNEAEHNLFPLRAVGITTDNLAPLMVPSPESERWAEAFAREHWREATLRLGVHPGAGKTQNIWPPENFAAVVDALSRRREVSLVVIEGPRDAASVAAFARACSVRGEVVRGKSISDVAALLKRADLVICNDTGVMHVAAAAGAHVLAVFGPTDPVRWAPLCNGLTVVRAPEGDLKAVTSEMVVERAAEVLGGLSSQPARK